VVAAPVHCAAVTDDSSPDEAAADSVRPDLVRGDLARDDSVRDERSVAPSTDAHCAPVVLDDSFPDGCSVPVDSVQDDSAVPRATDHCALAARTHDCCPAGYLAPVGSAEGESPDWADWAQAGLARAGLARAGLAAAGWAVVCCCSAHSYRADCLVAQAPDYPSALVAQTDGSRQVADDCRVDSVVDGCPVDSVADDYSASADFPAEADSPDCSPGVRSPRADSPEQPDGYSADFPGEFPPPGAELLSLAAR
jgi:hypothetical protein